MSDLDDESDVTESSGKYAARTHVPAVDDGYWSPGARLVARRTTTPTVRRTGTGGSGILLALAILLLAALIAVGLWLAALWAQSNDDESPEETSAAISLPIRSRSEAGTAT